MTTRRIPIQSPSVVPDHYSGPSCLCANAHKRGPATFSGSSVSGAVDYCIPLANDGATEGERLRWQIPFGSTWSDTWQAGLVVFLGQEE